MAVDTPAVVVGAGINGLGVARSLARARVPVWLLDTDARSAEMHTRAAKVVRIGALQDESFVDELVDIGTSRFARVRPVLFLTQEETVKTVSRYRERLSDLYRFSLPSTGVVDALLHKQGFQRVAEQLGGPIPRLVHIRTVADLRRLENLHFPVVVKPGERNREYAQRFKKAYRVESKAETLGLVGRILSVAPDVVVQEWIDGPDASLYFCLQYLNRQGRATATFTGRKIRSWPPEIGGTASCTVAPEAHAELAQLTTRFFRAAGVVGMAGMEYKRDARSGAFRMVEPTIGRTDYQEEVATLNGVNLPHAGWCAELGLTFPPPVIARRPVSWHVRSEDAQSAALQGQSSHAGYPSGGRIVDALWRWRDPMPFVVARLRHVRRALRTRTSKFVPGSQTARSKS